MDAESSARVLLAAAGFFISARDRHVPRPNLAPGTWAFPSTALPGPFNAITDVKGVEVGHTTLISGSGPLKVGVGPVRTGVTAILPRGKISWTRSSPAGSP